MSRTRVLTDDFIDEAVVRFARSTSMELARYIEEHTLMAVRNGFQPTESYRPGDILVYVHRKGGKMPKLELATVVADDGDCVVIEHPEIGARATIDKCELRPVRLVQV